MRVVSLIRSFLPVVLLTAAFTAGRAAPAAPARVPLPPDTMRVAMDEVGRHGGRFVAGVTASPKTFNPIIANETSTNDVVSEMFVALSDIDYRTQDDIPVVAKSWKFSNGGRTVTYKLRRGARFSDGHPITSADVKFSFDVATDSTLHSSMGDGLVMAVNGKPARFTYSAPDPATFVVTSPAIDALFLSHVANVRIVPKHVLEPAFKAGRFASSYTTATPPAQIVTSGPWRLKSHLENQQTVLEPNPYWFGADAKGQRLPYLDELVYRVAKDQDVAALMFHAGELDGLDNVKPEDYRQYTEEQKTKGFTLYDAGTSFNTNFMWFNLNRVRKADNGKNPGDPIVEPYKFAWFSNPDFRRAVSMAIDRESIIRGPYYGYGAKTWTIFPQGNARWYDPTVKGADYDPERAKALLDGLGLKDRNGDGVREDAAGHPVSFTVITNGDNKLRMSMAALIQDDLAKVGIKMVPAGLDFNTLVTKTRSDHQYEACMLGLGSAVPADPGMGPNFWKTSGLTHYWDQSQPEGQPDTPVEARFDTLFARNLATVNLAQRKAAFHDLAQHLNDQCLVVWLPTVLLRIPVSNRFGNVHPSPMPPRILWNSQTFFLKNPTAAR